MKERKLRPLERLSLALPILDTNILVSMLKGEREAIDRIDRYEENGSQLSTTVINTYELLRGGEHLFQV